MVQAARYDTADVAQKDRFAYWRDAVCDSYVQLGCEAPQASDFEGNLSIERYAQLAISHVGGAAHSVVRRKRDIRAATDEFFLLSLQREKTSRITQFGNMSVLRPGDMGIYDSASPYLLELSAGFSKTVVQLPKDRLLARLPMAQMMGGTRIDGQSAMGKLVRDNIVAFSEQLQSGDETLTALLQDALIDLIATGVAAGAEMRADLASPEQHILMRARSFISDNIRDPDLDRNMVAAHIGMSVRRLNSIFAKDSSSIAEKIRQSRLDLVAADLRDPRHAGLSISEVAMNCGYNNLQHFSTAFRTKFGVPPKAWRAGED